MLVSHSVFQFTTKESTRRSTFNLLARATGTMFALCVIAGLPGCSSMRPKVERITPRIDGISLEGVDMSFDVAVRNNAVIAMPVPRGAYAIKVADHDVAAADDVPGANIPPSAEGTITLPVRVRYADIWNAARQMVDAKQVPYELAGTVTLELLGQQFPLELEHEGQFPVMRAPRLSEVTVDKPTFSLSGADVTISANLTNPNVFALGLTGLGCEIRIGDQLLGNVNVSTTDSVQPDGSAPLTARCHLSSTSAAQQLIGGNLQKPAIVLVGSIDTPYGSVLLSDVQAMLENVRQ